MTGEPPFNVYLLPVLWTEYDDDEHYPQGLILEPTEAVGLGMARGEFRRVRMWTSKRRFCFYSDFEKEERKSISRGSFEEISEDRFDCHVFTIK